MAAWSGLIRPSRQILLQKTSITASPLLKNVGTRLSSDHRTFPLRPSNWFWDKTKDLFHLYICIGAIPIGLGILLTNIFVGPATLEPIPEGYVPKEWEYYRSPITRFLARYVYTSNQQEYEKFMHFLWTEQEVMKCRELEQQVMELIKNRKDYQAYYYQPYTNAKYVRRSGQIEKDSHDMYGLVHNDE